MILLFQKIRCCAIVCHNSERSRKLLLILSFSFFFKFAHPNCFFFSHVFGFHFATGLHNFPEGLATFVAALNDPKVGAVLAVAVSSEEERGDATSVVSDSFFFLLFFNFAFTDCHTQYTRGTLCSHARLLCHWQPLACLLVGSSVGTFGTRCGRIWVHHLGKFLF